MLALLEKNDCSSVNCNFKTASWSKNNKVVFNPGISNVGQPMFSCITSLIERRQGRIVFSAENSAFLIYSNRLLEPLQNQKKVGWDFIQVILVVQLWNF